MSGDRPISQQTVVTQVMSRIKDLIASDQYRPGDKLPTEQELAARFGVGRSSIREAMKVFQYLGVLESKTAKGTFIRDRANISLEAITWALLLGDDDLLDVFELREAIESICFRRLASGLAESSPKSRATLAALRKEVAVMEMAASDGDKASVAQADYRFHELIIAAGANRLFIDVYHTLQAFMTQEISKSYESMSQLIDAATDHAGILDVLEGSAVDEAVARHAAHFIRTRRLLGLRGKEGTVHEAFYRRSI